MKCTTVCYTCNDDVTPDTVLLTCTVAVRQYHGMKPTWHTVTWLYCCTVIFTSVNMIEEAGQHSHLSQFPPSHGDVGLNRGCSTNGSSTVLFYILSCPVLYSTDSTVLHFSTLYCKKIYCTILWYTILYCRILFCIVMNFSAHYSVYCRILYINIVKVLFCCISPQIYIF